MTEESEIHNLLVGAVPALSAPPDRLAAIGARVRRTQRRQRTAAIGTLVVAVALTATAVHADRPPATHRPVAPVASASTTSTDVSCPGMYADADRPDGIVFPAGATAITLCVAMGPLFDPTRAWFDGHHEPRTLTVDVSAMLATLNAHHTDTTCTPAPTASLYQYSLVASYPDGWQETLAPRACGTDAALVDAFLARYRHQLATGHPGLGAPGCPAEFTADQLDWRYSPTLDGIGANRGNDQVATWSTLPFLPSALAAVTACGYRAHGATWIPSGIFSAGAGLAGIRATLDGAAPHGDQTNPVAGCPPTAHAPQSFVSIYVLDVTGAVSEMRVWQTPCRAVQTYLGITGHLTPALTTWLTATGLG